MGCGQLHCRNSGNFRLSVGASVTILTQGFFVSGEGVVRCKCVKEKSCGCCAKFFIL